MASNEKECKDNEHVLVMVSENDKQIVYRCSKCGKLIVEKKD